ncbi:MAG: hypothetical protein ACYC0F_05290 [Rhodanobacter sp.]
MKTEPQATSLNERQAQARLERMLAARRAAEDARTARYRSSRTPRSQFRADAKASPRDIRLAPSPPWPAERFPWRDAGVFLLPVAALAALALLAHWAGWIR